MMTDPDVILSEREGPGFETLGTTPDPSGDGTALRMTDPDVILSNAKDLGLRSFRTNQILRRSAPQNDIIPRSGLGLIVVLSEREGPGSGSQKKNQISRTLHSLDTTKGFIRNTEGF